MSEMVERVAKAIFAVHNRTYDSWEEAGGDIPSSTTRTYYFNEARAAIEAMREPTQAMWEAAAYISRSDAEPCEEWKALVDAALR